MQSTFLRDKQALAIAEGQPIPVGKMVINLFKNPTYMLSVLCITNVMFVIIGLQFWAVQYGTVVLKEDPTYVYILFSFLCGILVIHSSMHSMSVHKRLHGVHYHIVGGNIHAGLHRANYDGDHIVLGNRYRTTGCEFTLDIAGNAVRNVARTLRLRLGVLIN